LSRARSKPWAPPKKSGALPVLQSNLSKISIL
jgi:hypothetical protein